jgi:hypothetical protein
MRPDTTRDDPREEPCMATCPECDFDDIDTEDYDEGDTLSCPECGKNLVLLGPDELEVADDDEDDLDDEDEDLEEDEDDEDDLDDEDEDEEEEDFDE